MTTEEKLKLAIETLEFYAAKSNKVRWDSGCGCCQVDFNTETNPVEDHGAKASDCLKKICDN